MLMMWRVVLTGLVLWSLTGWVQSTQLKFPSLNDILENKLSGKKFELVPGCFIILKDSETECCSLACSVSLTSEPPGCYKLQNLAERLFGKSSDIVKQIVNTLGLPIRIKSLDIDRKTKEFLVDLEVKSGLDFSLVSNLIKLSDVSILLKCKFDQDCTFNISGIWIIQSLKMKVSAVKSGDNVTINGSPVSDMSMNSLMSLGKHFSFTEQTDQFSKDLDVGSTSSLSNVHLYSRFTKKGFAVRVAVVLNNKDFGSPELNFIFSKNSIPKETFALALTGTFTNLKLATFLKTLTKIDISHVPVIGKITFQNLRFSYATTEFDNEILDEGKIENGLHLISNFKMAYNGPDIAFSVSIFGSDMSFKVSSDTGFTVKEFIGLLTHNHFVKFLMPLKFDLDSFLKLKLQSFIYYKLNNTFTINAELPVPIKVVPKAIELHHTRMKYTIQMASKHQQIEFSTQWKLGSLYIPFKISKSSAHSYFIAEARPQMDISFGSMIKQFLVGLLPSGPLESAVRKAGFEGFYIQNASIKFHFTSDYTLRVGGIATIGTWKACKVEIILGKIDDAFVMATGIVLNKMPLTKVIHKLTNGKINLSKLPGASILDNTDVGISMSSEQIPKVNEMMQYSIEGLRSAEILDGVVVSASFKFPPNCEDIACKVFKRLLGSNAHFVVQGRLSLEQVYIKATLSMEIPIFKGVNITNIGFVLEVGTFRRAIAITGSLKFSNPDLTFTGGFGILNTGVGIQVYLEMSMAGWWRKPFGIPYLAIGNLHFSVGITHDPMLIASIQLGGQGMLGLFDNPKAKPINVSMYIGIDRTSNTENYFYGSTSALTIKSFLEAFALSVPLPDALTTSGFPKGLKTSFSLRTRRLPNGITIPRGYYLQGMIKILFFEVYTDIKINLNGIFMNMTVKSFSIGNGLISISGRPGELGPRLLVDVGWNPSRALINIEGSIEVLKIKVTTNITISTSGVRFQVSGSFLDLFEAGLDLRSSYSSLSKTDFWVSGYFKQHLLDKLKKAALELLDKYKHAADKAIESAKQHINDAKKVFDSAANKLKDLQNKLNNQKSKFDNVNKELESKKKIFESKKKIFDDAARKLRSARDNLSNKQRSYNEAVSKKADKLKKGCPSACRKKRSVATFLESKKAKEFIKPEHKRIKRWGRFRVRLPRIRIPRIPVKNPLEIGREGAERLRERAEEAREFTSERGREAKCLALKGVRATCLGVISGLEAAVKSAGKILDGAKLALKVAEKTVSASKVSMDIAKGAVSVAQGVVSGAKKALDVAVIALKAGETLVRNTKHTLDLAIGALEVARKVNEFGVEIGKKILSFGLGELLNIHEIKFDVRLAAAETGRFTASISATILGKKIERDFEIRIRSVSDMVKSLVNMVKGIAGIRVKRSIEQELHDAVSKAVGTRKEMKSCYVYTVVSDITKLLLNETEDFVELIPKLESLTKTYDNENSDEVTTADIIELEEMAVGDLLVAIDTVLDFYSIKLSMSHDQVIQLLRLISQFSSDVCLKRTGARLSQIFDHPLKNLSVTEDRIRLLHSEARCLRKHRCLKRS